MQVATQLLWGDESDLERVRASGPFDLIVGSDLLYAPHIFALLLDTLVELCSPGLTEVLLTYPTRYAVADATPTLTLALALVLALALALALTLALTLTLTLHTPPSPSPSQVYRGHLLR